MTDILPIILYILGSILLVVLIILGIKMIIVMDKLQVTVDNINNKVNSLNGLFSMVDFATDKLALVTEKVTDGVSSLVRKIFRNKKDEEDEYE